MSEHFEAVEADWAREYPNEYNGDLRQALWGPNPIGTRRLGALLQGLGPRSAVARAANGGIEWTQQEELDATVAELVRGR